MVYFPSIFVHTAVQIVFVGHGHWICTSYTEADGVCIYDSLPGEDLPCDIQIQIAKLCGGVAIDGVISIDCCITQKQIGAKDCGVCSIFIMNLMKFEMDTKIKFDKLATSRASPNGGCTSTPSSLLTCTDNSYTFVMKP